MLFFMNYIREYNDLINEHATLFVKKEKDTHTHTRKWCSVLLMYI